MSCPDCNRGAYRGGPCPACDAEIESESRAESEALRLAEQANLRLVYREDLDRVRNDAILNLQEGSQCPNGCEGGLMYFSPVEDCTCFQNAPCHRCIENEIRCPVCRTTLSEFNEEFENKTMPANKLVIEPRIPEISDEDRKRFLVGDFTAWGKYTHKMQLQQKIADYVRSAPPLRVDIDYAAGPDQTAICMAGKSAVIPAGELDTIYERAWSITGRAVLSLDPRLAKGCKVPVPKRGTRVFDGTPIVNALSVSCQNRNHLLGSVRAWHPDES